jgi:hypothetical protein
MTKIVIATTTRYASVNDLRAQLALEAMEAYAAHDYEVVVVDGGSDPLFRVALADSGVHLIDELPNSTMGAGRRQAMRIAGELAGNDGVVLWTEPEKPLAHLVHEIVHPILLGYYDMVIPSRASLDSYPPEQAHAEQMGNLAVNYLLGRTLDFWFGVMAMDRAALDIVLAYNGEYGDLWDSLMIPRLHAMAAGLMIGRVLVYYVHPAAQTKAETGQIDMLLKRVDQLDNIVRALDAETKKLGIGIYEASV